MNGEIAKLYPVVFYHYKMGINHANRSKIIQAGITGVSKQKSLYENVFATDREYLVAVLSIEHRFIQSNETDGFLNDDISFAVYSSINQHGISVLRVFNRFF